MSDIHPRLLLWGLRLGLGGLGLRWGVRVSVGDRIR